MSDTSTASDCLPSEIDPAQCELECSDISTPTFDGLARDGIRLTNFHTTALCSPTRACLLTGRNHHRNGMGRVADLAVGYPGYCGRIPRENGFLSEILRAHGYATYAVGKWHLTPEDETHMAASRTSWPLARGFDRWYETVDDLQHSCRFALIAIVQLVMKKQRPPSWRPLCFYEADCRGEL